MAHRCKKQCGGSRRWENQAKALTGNSTIIGGTAPKDVTCRTGNRMKQNRLILVAAGATWGLGNQTTKAVKSTKAARAAYHFQSLSSLMAASYRKGVRSLKANRNP